MTAAPSFPAPEAATGLRSKLLDAGQIDHALLSLLVPRTLSLIAHVRRHLLHRCVAAPGCAPVDPSRSRGRIGRRDGRRGRRPRGPVGPSCRLHPPPRRPGRPPRPCAVWACGLGRPTAAGGGGGPAGLWHPRPAGSDRIAAFVLLSAVLPTPARPAPGARGAGRRRRGRRRGGGGRRRRRL